MFVSSDKKRKFMTEIYKTLLTQITQREISGFRGFINGWSRFFLIEVEDR